MCMFIPSPVKKGINNYFGIKSVQFFQIELKPVKRVNVDANLKRFQHRRKPSLNMGELWVAEPIACGKVKKILFLLLKSVQNFDIL